MAGMQSQETALKLSKIKAKTKLTVTIDALSSGMDSVLQQYINKKTGPLAFFSNIKLFRNFLKRRDFSIFTGHDHLPRLRFPLKNEQKSHTN